MFPKAFFKIILIGGCLAALTACKAGGPGLGGSTDSSLAVCPPGGCSDLNPDQSQLNLSYLGKTTLYQQAVVDIGTGSTIDMIDVGGDCYASTYPNNRLEIEVYMATTTRVTLGTLNVRSTFASQNEVRCQNGRFGFSLNGARLLSGAVYRIDVALIGIDANGREFRNSGNGTFSVSVSR